MCLHISYKKSFIAKSDIEVYKYVDKEGQYYYTACRHYPINLNELLEADEEKQLILKCNTKYCINGGAIHACTATFNNGFIGKLCLKAIIKKGTEFYIQDDLKDVAAKEMYITDEEITDKRSTDLSDYFEDVFKDAESNNNGIKVGYYLLSNGKFISPFDYKEGIIIGVVALFDKNNNPISMSIKSERLPWLRRIFDNKISSDIYYNKVIEDINGRIHTKNILHSEDYDPDNFMAIEYCNNYYTEGTKPGDWYMPAIGECLKTANNMLIINIVLSKAGFDIYTWDDSLWSSSECSPEGDSCVWNCNMLDGTCYRYKSSKQVSLRVCPYINLIKKSNI